MDDESIAANKYAEDVRKSELHDLRNVLLSPSGRRVLARLMERTGPLRQTFNIDSERLTALASGERNIGLWILAELSDAAPESIGQILTDMQKPNHSQASNADTVTT